LLAALQCRKDRKRGHITVNTMWAQTFAQVVGQNAFAQLPPAMVGFFDKGGVVEGRFAVQRGGGVLPWLVCAVGGLPPAAQQCLVRVVSSAGGSEHRTFDGANDFVSHFAAAPDASGTMRVVERVLGGLVQFEFDHRGAPAAELAAAVHDRAACARLYGASVENAAAGDDGIDRGGKYFGWRGQSTGVRLLWGVTPLVPGPALLRVRDLNVPHADGRGWYVEVELSSPFLQWGADDGGLIVRYAGHVRVVPPVAGDTTN
jgi:hypothetical protein